ncbi:MAG TPA: hypothetical protein DCD97_02615, partial [Firmicutes bacterium]|nr:hypothetical protein [Bacillota bacterium]
MSTDLAPTAAVAASRHEGTPAASRHGTRKGDDFARLLKGLFPKELSSSPLSGDEQASKLPEKEPANCSTEQQLFFLGTEMISEPGAPPDTKQPGIVLQLFEQVPADPVPPGLPEVELGEAGQFIEEPAAQPEELQLSAGETAAGAGLNLLEESGPGVAGSLKPINTGNEQVKSQNSLPGLPLSMTEGEYAGQKMPAAVQGDPPAGAQGGTPSSNQGELPAESLPVPAKSLPASPAANTQVQEEQGMEGQLSSGQISGDSGQDKLIPQARALSFSYLQVEKSLQEHYPSILTGAGEFPGEKMAALAESDTSHIAPASFSSMMSSGEEQGKNMAAGEENLYPAFSGEEGESALSTEGNSKAAAEAKTFSHSFPRLQANLQPHSREIMEQITSRMDYLARPGGQELRLKLQPEFLGEVLIRVRRIKGILSAEIITQHLAVKELLE